MNLQSAGNGKRTCSRYSRYLGVLWDEKIGYEDGLRRAGCHGKRRRENSDWQISIQYGACPKSYFFFVGL